MDFTKMLEELLEFEQNIGKSDTIVQSSEQATLPNDKTIKPDINPEIIEQKQVSFTEQQTIAGKSTLTKSILKTSNSNIVPDYVPMAPQGYDSDVYSSRIDSDSSVSDSESGGSFSEEESVVVYGSEKNEPSELARPGNVVVEFETISSTVESRENMADFNIEDSRLNHQRSVDSSVGISRPIVSRFANIVQGGEGDDKVDRSLDYRLVDSYSQPDAQVKFEETKVSIVTTEQEAPKMHFFGQKVETVTPIIPVTHIVPPVVQFYGQQIPVRESDTPRDTSIDSDGMNHSIDSIRRNQSIDSVRTESELSRKAIDLPRTRNESPQPGFKPNYDSPRKEEPNRKITTRVYFETPANFKTIEIDSTMTARGVIDLITNLPEMALFELINDLGIERPFFEWESVFSVLSNWTPGNNCILVKKYGYCATLTLKYLNERYPRIQGYIYTEIRSKWRKRFFELRDHLLYFYESAEDPTSISLICDLTLANVYNLNIKRESPTEFIFAIKSKIQGFQNEETTRFLCVKTQERLLDWVLALRMAKGERMRRFETDFDTQSVVSDAQSVVSLDSLPLIKSLKIQEERRRKSKGEKTGRDGKEKSRRVKPLLDFKNDGKCKSCGCVLGGDTKKICAVCRHVHS